MQFTIWSIKTRILFVLFRLSSREGTLCVRDTCREMILQINDDKFIAFLFRIEWLMLSVRGDLGVCKKKRVLIGIFSSID